MGRIPQDPGNIFFVQMGFMSPIPDQRTNAQPEEKFLLSPYEVRLKLAVAYLEIGDSEGACLLLEDVIRDAPEDQKQHAQRLLLSIEAKQVRYCGNSEEIYFN